MAQLTDHERDRVLHFLGYPAWAQLAASIQLGFPMASQPLFLVYNAIVRLTDGGSESVRRDLCECEAIEAQLRDARGRFKARSVGNMELNPMEAAMLRKELGFWSKRLADDLGVVSNPYSQMEWQGGVGGGGGVFGKVTG